MERAQILEKIRRIELKLRKKTFNRGQGEYKSSSKGEGLVFSEVRKYSYGDDVRNIDWNVTARYKETHVKVFEEEKDKNIVLLIDISSSNLLGYDKHFKKIKSIEIAATIMLSAHYHQMAVGAVFFASDVEQYFPIQKGKQNILHIINALIDCNNLGLETSLKNPVRWCSKNIKRKSTVILVSDFQANQNYFEELKFLHVKHELVLVHLKSKIDFKLPKVGIVKVYNPETNVSEWVNSDIRAVREKFNSKKSERIDILNSFCRKNKLNKHEVDCENEVFLQLNKMFL